MKTCPYCAEKIQEQAIVCKHCGRELAPEAVATVARDLEVKAGEAPEPRAAPTLDQSQPEAVLPEIDATPESPIWRSAVYLAGALTLAYLVYRLARVIFGQTAGEGLSGGIITSLLVVFLVTMVLSTIGVWLWRAVTTPLPSEIESVSSGSAVIDTGGEEAPDEPAGEAAEDSSMTVVDADEEAEPEPVDSGEPGVYSIPKGLVAARGEPQTSIWKRAAGVGGAFAALQSVILVGIFAVGNEPELIATLSPVQLILSIPLIFGIAFGVTTLVILGWRYATSPSE